MTGIHIGKEKGKLSLFADNKEIFFKKSMVSNATEVLRETEKN